MNNFHDFSDDADCNEQYERVEHSYGEFCYFIHRNLDDVCDSRTPALLSGNDLIPLLTKLSDGGTPEQVGTEAANLIYKRAEGELKEYEKLIS